MTRRPTEGQDRTCVDRVDAVAGGVQLVLGRRVMAGGNEREISSLVERWIERITDQRVVEKIRPLLVTPYPVERLWDYGAPGERFTCWTVLEHVESNTGIAFCSEGLARAEPRRLRGRARLVPRHDPPKDTPEGLDTVS